MLYQSDEDKKEFAFSSPALLCLVQQLEFEIAKYSSSLELISFDEFTAMLTTTGDDFDLIEPCALVGMRFLRTDGKLSCSIYDFDRRIIQCYATSHKDLEYLL